MLTYFKAKVSIKVFGISGESQEGVSCLVESPNVNLAQVKFENYCREKFKHMEFQGIRFEYLEIAPQI
jgi:hypothetical protein